MDNKEQNKDIQMSEFDKDNYKKDYMELVRKLKIINSNVDLLEKSFLKKEL